MVNRYDTLSSGYPKQVAKYESIPKISYEVWENVYDHLI